MRLQYGLVLRPIAQLGDRVEGFAVMHPWLFFVAAIVGFASGSAFVPAGFLPVRTLLYRGPLGVAVLGLWAVSLVMLWLAGRRYRNETSARKLVLIQLLAGGMVAFSAPVLLSSDPIAYVYYGVLALSGGNPWHPPAAANAPFSGVLVDAMRQLYVDPPVASIYGPVFILVERVLVQIVGSAHVVLLVFLQRAIALAAACAVTLALPNDRRARWALDPFVLFVTALDAHNDIWFIALLAVMLGLRSKTWASYAAAASAFALAVATKAIAAFALVLRPLPGALGLVAVAAWYTFARGNWDVTPHVTQASLLLVREDGVPIWIVLTVRVLLSLGLLGIALALGRRRRDWDVQATLLLVTLIPVIQPWYVLWAVFVDSATHPSKALSSLVIIFEIGAVLLYIPAVL